MNDPIEREDAIKAVRESKPWHFNEIVPVLSAIKGIPSAEPKRERCEYCKDGNFIGQRIMLGNDGKWHKILFCPNCGADMRGEK